MNIKQNEKAGRPFNNGNKGTTKQYSYVNQYLQSLPQPAGTSPRSSPSNPPLYSDIHCPSSQAQLQQATPRPSYAPSPSQPASTSAFVPKSLATNQRPSYAELVALSRPLPTPSTAQQQTPFLSQPKPSPPPRPKVPSFTLPTQPPPSASSSTTTRTVESHYTSSSSQSPSAAPWTTVKRTSYSSLRISTSTIITSPRRPSPASSPRASARFASPTTTSSPLRNSSSQAFPSPLRTSSSLPPSSLRTSSSTFVPPSPLRTSSGNVPLNASFTLPPPPSLRTSATSSSPLHSSTTLRSSIDLSSSGNLNRSSSAYPLNSSSGRISQPATSSPSTSTRFPPKQRSQTFSSDTPRPPSSPSTSTRFSQRQRSQTFSSDTPPLSSSPSTSTRFPQRQRSETFSAGTPPTSARSPKPPAGPRVRNISQTFSQSELPPLPYQSRIPLAHAQFTNPFGRPTKPATGDQTTKLATTPRILNLSKTFSQPDLPPPLPKKPQKHTQNESTPLKNSTGTKTKPAWATTPKETTTNSTFTLKLSSGSTNPANEAKNKSGWGTTPRQALQNTQSTPRVQNYNKTTPCNSIEPSSATPTQENKVGGNAAPKKTPNSITPRDPPNPSSTPRNEIKTKPAWSTIPKQNSANSVSTPHDLQNPKAEFGTTPRQNSVVSISTPRGPKQNSADPVTTPRNSITNPKSEWSTTPKQNSTDSITTPRNATKQTTTPRNPKTEWSTTSKQNSANPVTPRQSTPRNPKTEWSTTSKQNSADPVKTPRQYTTPRNSQNLPPSHAKHAASAKTDSDIPPPLPPKIRKNPSVTFSASVDHMPLSPSDPLSSPPPPLSTPPTKKKKSSPLKTSILLKSSDPLKSSNPYIPRPFVPPSPHSQSLSSSNGRVPRPLDSPTPDGKLMRLSAHTKKFKKIKIMVIGDPGIGKSKMISRLVSQTYTDQYKPTVFETHSFLTKFGPWAIQLNIWEADCTEKYASKRPVCYPETSIFMICFDLSQPHSFNTAKEKWMDELQTHGYANTPKVFVGLKQDLSLGVQEEITYNQSYDNVTEEQYTICECSAKKGEGIDDIFAETMRKYIYYAQESQGLHWRDMRVLASATSHKISDLFSLFR
eukprot:Phypoly_transcript_00882.p1 GENE.Phypoly_transcript_00882~~Phypoly_transcript_00882.p1  ORF type:complete len:1105 (+),score=224.82 Phypoly_transcript_00882:596-3910(+)